MLTQSRLNVDSRRWFHVHPWCWNILGNLHCFPIQLGMHSEPSATCKHKVTVLFSSLGKRVFLPLVLWMLDYCVSPWISEMCLEKKNNKWWSCIISKTPFLRRNSAALLLCWAVVNLKGCSLRNTGLFLCHGFVSADCWNFFSSTVQFHSSFPWKGWK